MKDITCTCHIDMEDNDIKYSENDLREAFMAGFNRGVYVASVIIKQPIDSDYPTCEEYIKEKNLKTNKK